MWKLVIKDDEGRQIVVPLKQDEYVLGRKAGSRIRLVEMRPILRAFWQTFGSAV